MTCINYINHFCIKLIELWANQYQDSLFFIQRKVYISINYIGIPSNTVMLVTMLCWWLYDDDNFEMLVVIIMLVTFFPRADDLFDVKNRSWTSHSCHQHPAPTPTSPKQPWPQLDSERSSPHDKDENSKLMK